MSKFKTFLKLYLLAILAAALLTNCSTQSYTGQITKKNIININFPPPNQTYNQVFYVITIDGTNKIQVSEKEYYKLTNHQNLINYKGVKY